MRIATCISISTGYRDKDTFGVVKKGKFYLASDFNFDYVAEVISEDPASSGYLLSIF